MADAVSSQTLENGKRNLVMKFTNISDGTGESGVVKVDISALDPLMTGVRILKAMYDINGMEVQILWDATTPTVAMILGAGKSEQEFMKFGGLKSNAGAGVTGDIKFTTLNATANDTYTITLWMKKVY
jgi:hypothetical protein